MIGVPVRCNTNTPPPGRARTSNKPHAGFFCCGRKHPHALRYRLVGVVRRTGRIPNLLGVLWEEVDTVWRVEAFLRVRVSVFLKRERVCRAEQFAPAVR